MSSLAAARADNFYYPPQYDPSKGSLNKFNGQHPLRERAKKLGEGILIIRFEMPFNVWCGKCNHLIGKGVRFNAEKKAIGNYHSTKIWSFRMTTPCCQNKVEIHTDPKNARYIIVEGAKQKEETWTAADAETMELPDSDERPKLNDPFAKLEHGNEDARRGRDARNRLTELYSDSAAKFQDDYATNKALRRAMRDRRKEAKATDARRQALGLPDTVPLAPESADDAQLAALITFGDGRAHERAQSAQRQQIQGGDIFRAPPGKGRLKPVVPARRQALGSSRLAASSGAMKRSSGGAATTGMAGQPATSSRTPAGAGSRRKVVVSKTRHLLSLGVKLGLSEPT
jgi:coiled-coil domain-containing protein 130